MELGLFLILLVNIGLISAGEWGDPVFIRPDNFPCSSTETCPEWIFDTTNNRKPVFIQFKEELDDPILITYVTCTNCGNEGPQIGSFTTGSRTILDPELKKVEDDKYALYINKKLDYEVVDQREFKFSLLLSGAIYEMNVKIDLLDIDDNPPRITVHQTPCEIPENQPGETNCTYSIVDPDTVNSINDIEFIFSEFKETFEIKRVPINKTNTDAVLFVLTELDFETKPMYFFELMAKDVGGNSGTASIMIKVKDENDTPPRWQKIFAMESLDEHTEQNYLVSAQDGDLEINDIILYNWKEKCHDNIKITEVKSNNSAIITVKDIDRDIKEIEDNDNTIRCTLVASEQSSDKYSTPAEISFIIQDINDNKPIITLSTTAESPLKLREEEFITLDKIFRVDDIDQGNNAQFDVTLVNGKSTKIDYTKPFQVIPNNGYRNWDFSMSVIEPDLLDYDKTEDWHKFSIKIHSKDKGEESQEDDQIIQIELINLNDEIPIFDKTINYAVEIKENAIQGAYILNVLAIDDDVGDKVVYDLPVESGDYKLTTHPNKSVTISTTRDNVFDYEKLKIVYIQITATDTLKITDEPDNFHTVTQQITVHVIDVNDEKPRLSLPNETPLIKEHSEVGAVLDSKITAIDVDTSALLKFSIDWENSRASKLGVQEKDISLFEEVFILETTFPDENNKGYAVGIFTVNDKDRLDYEVFDTLLLNINVEDKNQEIFDGTDTGMMTILIQDINDNKPEFKMETINSQKNVEEHSASGRKIATIVATDKDGPPFNKITYFLEPIENTAANLVEINPENGDLIVVGNIDADDPDYIKYLTYNVTAGDMDFNTTEKIVIDVDDINDNKPYLRTALSNTLSVNERNSSDPEECIQKIDGHDCDRDKPRNVVTYEINDEITQLWKTYRINDKNEICAYGNIEWKNDERTVQIYIKLSDNIGGQGGSNIEKFNFTLKINDVDNNSPVLPQTITITKTIREDTEPGVISQFIATDKDEPCTDHTKIQYSIKLITDEKDKEITEELFIINKIVNADDPNCQQIAQLEINKSLRYHYGVIKIKVGAENPGTSGNSDEKTYNVFVEPSNYKPPEILIPKESTILLAQSQKVGDPLITLEGKPIKDFEATDAQDDKFVMNFLPGTPWDPIFELIPNPDEEKNKARLILKINEPPNPEYILQLRAEHNGLGSSDNFIEKTITLKFIDKNQLPSFNALEDKVSFWENETDVTCEPFLKADDPKCIDLESDCWSTTYYHIMNTEEKINFRTDNSDQNEPKLCLEKYLDREEQAQHSLIIVATNYETAPDKKPDGYEPLTLLVEVRDINDNPPAFESKLFRGGLADNYKIGSVIVTLKATDPDEVDQGLLKYKIVENSISVSPNSGLDEIKNDAFDIKDNQILNKFQPTQQMKGYFLFKVQVLDSFEYYDIAEVKIHITSDANRVIIKFNDDVDFVRSKEEDIKDILSKVLGYTCVIDDIERKENDTTKATSYITEVKTHFLDEQEETVDNDIIEVKLGDLVLIGNLEILLKAVGLDLIRVNKEDEIENLDKLLIIILGVVSVVLGTLCIILILAFCLRTRSLKNRLGAMTTNVFGSTKSDLNRIGTNAPNTNRHAIEANPVWNEDLNSVNQYDTMSQASDGSDLIGVEDKPDFEYDFRRASINPVIQQNLQKISQQNGDNDIYSNNVQKMSNQYDDDDINSLPDSYSKSTLF